MQFKLSELREKFTTSPNPPETHPYQLSSPFLQPKLHFESICSVNPEVEAAEKMSISDESMHHDNQSPDATDNAVAFKPAIPVRVVEE